MSDKKLNLNLLAKQIIAGAFLIGSIIAYGFIVHMYKTDNNVKANDETSEVEYFEYSQLNNMKSIDIALDKFMDIPAVQDEAKTYGLVEKRYRRKSCTVTKAYLYINATVFNAPLNSHESICFGLSDACRRIALDQNSLPVPQTLTSVSLYNLEKISFGNNKNAVEDLLPIINTTSNDSTFTTAVFLSSNRRARYIDRITIYYECGGPEDNCKKGDEECGLIRYK